MKPYTITLPQPFYWIGIRKGWQTTAQTLMEAMVSLPPSDLGTHLLLIGASGSGKSKALEHIIAQHILMQRSFVIIDYRGDLTAAATELLANRVDPAKVAILDLRGEPTIGFDPLSGAGPLSARALSFVSALEAIYGGFGPQLSDTARNAALILAECGEPITQIESLLYDPLVRERLTRHSKDESVRGFWQRYSDSSEEKRNLLASPVLNKHSLLMAAPTLKALLASSSTLDLGKHLNTRGSILLVSLAADQTSPAAARMLGNLVLSCITREIFARIDTDEAERNPTTLIVDEFPNFDSKNFESILAEGRKYRVSLALANQVLAQLDATMRSLLLNNIGAKLIFRTGREDGAILSKDLTGDAKALDLVNLAVGEAYLWRRSQGLVHLEINRPLLKSTGRRSHSAREFLKQVRDHWSSLSPARPEQDLIDAPEREPRDTPQKPANRLEDWLQ